MSGENGTQRVRIALASTQDVVGFALVGSGGSVQAFAHTPDDRWDAVSPSVPVRESTTRWQRVVFATAVHTDAIELRWTGGTAQDQLAEVELWGMAAPNTQGFSDSHAETVAVGAGFFVIGGNYSGGTSTTTSQLMDVTGDGNIFWRKSPVANASNMLRTITSPLGATTTLEFAREGNSARQTVVINGEPTTTYMPHNEWVLSRVRTVESPTRENTPGYFSTTRYDYHRSGNYDPAARESYGFAWVTTIRDDNARTESYFHNQDY